MTEILVVGFVIAWFIFWGWMFINRPDTAFKFNQMGKDNLDHAGKLAGKVVNGVVKRIPKG